MHHSPVSRDSALGSLIISVCVFSVASTATPVPRPGMLLTSGRQFQRALFPLVHPIARRVGYMGIFPSAPDWPVQLEERATTQGCCFIWVTRAAAVDGFTDYGFLDCTDELKLSQSMGS